MKIKNTLNKVTVVFLGFLAIASCGKYPEKEEAPEVHNAGIANAPTAAELTGEGYTPKFLSAGYKTIDVEYEIKETIVDLGGGFKYRALTYDGSFPAKMLVAEQGTLVRIKVKNTDSSPHGIHTHVIKYTPENDGAGLSETAAGQTRYYFWEVTTTTPVGFYPFHDHGGDNEGAQARGLLGIISVVKAGETANAGFGLLLHDVDAAYLFSDSGARLPSSGGSHAHGGGGEGATEVPAHLVNGKFGEAPENTFEGTKGQKIHLGVINLGTDIHTFHSHGNSWTNPGGDTNDNLELLPGGYRTLEINAEAEGSWLYHCHVPGHPEGGMWGKYIVK